MNKILTFVTLATLALGFGMALNGSTAFAATPRDAVCEGASLSSTGPAAKSCTSTGPNIQAVIELIVNILSVIVGIVAVIMIIIGGFKYVTSQGDASNISSAKNTILYAIVGIVIVALAQVLVRYVLKRVIG